MSTSRKREGEKQRLHESTRIASSCLGTPVLPCAYCKEQVLSWTQEREERSSTHSPLRQWQTGTTDSETTHSHSRHTQNSDEHLLLPCHSSSFVLKHGETRIYNGTVHYCSWVHGGYVYLEHLYPFLAPPLGDYIMSHTASTPFISLWLSILHLGMYHTRCRLPSHFLCKTTCAAL